MPLTSLSKEPAETVEILRFDGDTVLAAERRLAVLKLYNDMLASDAGLRGLSDDDLADRHRHYLEYARAQVLYGDRLPVAAD